MESSRASSRTSGLAVESRLHTGGNDCVQNCLSRLAVPPGGGESPHLLATPLRLVFGDVWLRESPELLLNFESGRGVQGLFIEQVLKHVDPALATEPAVRRAARVAEVRW